MAPFPEGPGTPATVTVTRKDGSWEVVGATYHRGTGRCIASLEFDKPITVSNDVTFEVAIAIGDEPLCAGQISIGYAPVR